MNIVRRHERTHLQNLFTECRQKPTNVWLTRRAFRRFIWHSHWNKRPSRSRITFNQLCIKLCVLCGSYWHYQHSTVCKSTRSVWTSWIMMLWKWKKMSFHMKSVCHFIFRSISTIMSMINGIARIALDLHLILIEENPLTFFLLIKISLFIHSRRYNSIWLCRFGWYATKFIREIIYLITQRSYNHYWLRQEITLYQIAWFWRSKRFG